MGWPASICCSQVSSVRAKAPIQTHQVIWSAARTSYDIDGAQDLSVPLTWTNDQGVTVTKTYTFHRGLYSIGLQYNVQNKSEATWQAASYAQFLRNDPRTKSSMFNVESRAFHGAALDDGTKYRKLDLAADSGRQLIPHAMRPTAGLRLFNTSSSVRSCRRQVWRIT